MAGWMHGYALSVGGIALDSPADLVSLGLVDLGDLHYRDISQWLRC